MEWSEPITMTAPAWVVVIILTVVLISIPLGLAKTFYQLKIWKIRREIYDPADDPE